MRKYTKPEIEISVFTTEDIITTSAVDNDTIDTTVSLTNGAGLEDSSAGTKYSDIF